MSYIQVDHYIKILKGKSVLDDITLSIDRGRIVGFVGPNGCGKSMLFRAIAGLIRASSGSVRIDGRHLGKEISFPPHLGIIIENIGLWPGLTGMENLTMLAKIKKTIHSKEIIDGIVRVGLDPTDKRTFQKYSLGMKQRLVIAQAIMEHPELLILDEPTNALDESGVAIIRNIIKEEQHRGATILLSSHDPSDIDLLCDEIYHLYEGRMIKHEVR